MVCPRTFAIIAIALFVAFHAPAAAEVVYTPVNLSIPLSGFYRADLNHDGVPDFTVRSQIIQEWCVAGDGYSWNVSITPASGNAVVVSDGYYAAAMPLGTLIGSGQNFYTSGAFITNLWWGYCGAGTAGDWMGRPERYVGIKFRVSGSNDDHYGWIKLANVGYIDRYEHLQSRTIVQGFAYETVAGAPIRAGSQE